MNRKLNDPYTPVRDPTGKKTELDHRGVPKSLKSKHIYRTRNYFYRIFDHIGRQLAVVNQGLKDNGRVRTYQFK